MNQSPQSTLITHTHELEIDEILNKLLSAKTYFNL